MRWKRLRPAGIGLLGLLAVIPAWAGPPYLTDDPTPTHWGKWEINIPYQLHRTVDGQTMHIPLFDISYGLTPSVELNLSVPIEYSDPVDGPLERGFGDIIVGMKWRFCREGSRRPEMAVGPAVVLPTGDPDAGLGAGSPLYVLPVMALKSWSSWTVFGNAGVVIQTPEASRNFFYYGVVLAREVNSRLELGVDFAGHGPLEPGDPADVGLYFGSSWTLTSNVAVLASIGRSLRRDGAGLYLYSGIQLTLGTAKKPGARSHRATHHPLSP